MHHHHALSAAALLALSLATPLLFASEEPDPFPPGKEVALRLVAWQGGDVLVTVGETHAVAWDVATGKPRGQRRLGSAPTHEMVESPVSPDGKRLLVIETEPKEGIGRLVPIEDGPETVLASPGKGGPFQFLAWSPDGGRLLFVDEAHVLHLWDAASGKYVGKLGGPSDDPSSEQVTFVPPDSFRKMSYSGKPKPGNKVEASWGYDDVGALGGGGGTDGPCEAWRRPTWSPDGRFLLTMARMSRRQPVVVLWNGRTGMALASLSVPSRLYHQWAFSPDGRQFALLSADVAPGSDQARADAPWDEVVGDDFRGVKAPNDAVALRLIDPETGATLHRLDGDFSPHRFAWSPDSKRVLVAGMNLKGKSPTRDLACWDAATGRRVWSNAWQPKESKTLSMVYSPDGKYVALTAKQTKFEQMFDVEELWLHILDADSGKQVLEKKLDRIGDPDHPPNFAPVWCPSDDRVFAGGLVADARTGKVPFDLFPKRDDDRVPDMSAAWQPDGKLLAIWQDGKTPVRLISAADGKEVRQLPEAKP